MRFQQIFSRILFWFVFGVISVSGTAYAQNGQDDEPLTHFGQEVILNGANIAWINFGSDVGGQNSTAEAMRNEFQELASYGGNSARWWLHASGWFSPDINVDGYVRGISPNHDNGVSDLDMINQVRDVLDAAWDEGILLTISLFSYDIACGEDNNANGSVYRGSRFDGMLNVNYQSYFDNVLTPLVTELRDHPALFAWEIFNESDGMSTDGNFFEDNCPISSFPQTNETLQRFVNLAAARIHSIDPNVKVTTSVSQTAFLNQYTNDVLTSQNFSDPTGSLDFYQAHWYWSFGHPSNPYAITAQDRNLDKPIVLGEFQYGTEPETQTAPENLSQTLLTQGYAGAWIWDMLSLSESEVETVVSGASSFSPPIDKTAIEACISLKVAPCYKDYRLPRFIEPSPDLPLEEPTETFTWSDSVESATNYWLLVGSTEGGSDYFNSGNIGSSNSATVSDLPNDGSAVYFRLWYKVRGEKWGFVDEIYHTSDERNDVVPVMTTLLIDGKLTNASGNETFTWSDNGANITDYWLNVGSAEGGNDYHTSGNIGTITRALVTGLPTQPNEKIYVRLWYRVSGGAWEFIDEVYSSIDPVAGTLPYFTSPANGQLTDASGTETFTWTNNQVNADHYWITMGGQRGGSNYFNSGSISNTMSVTVSDLPTDGSTVYVTLWYRDDGQGWDVVDFEFTAVDQQAVTVLGCEQQQIFFI